jgi:hypothetical protein
MLGCVQRLKGLDQGDFTEGHELDRKWRVPKEMVGREVAFAASSVGARLKPFTGVRCP